jgi:hypothetical protein
MLGKIPLKLFCDRSNIVKLEVWLLKMDSKIIGPSNLFIRKSLKKYAISIQSDYMITTSKVGQIQKLIIYKLCDKLVPSIHWVLKENPTI